MARMAQKRLPRVVAISAGTASRHGELADWLDCCADARVEAVQLREKRLDDLELYRLALDARRRLPESTRILVNGRLDVAIAARADGIHLPSDGLPVAALRARFGSEPLIGRSTHALAEIETARDEGADFVTFGPVFATPGKERFGPPQGLKALRHAASLGLPVYALGGVTIDSLPELVRAGAAGVAGIRSFGDERLESLQRGAERLFGGDREHR